MRRDRKQPPEREFGFGDPPINDRTALSTERGAVGKKSPQKIQAILVELDRASEKWGELSASGPYQNDQGGETKPGAEYFRAFAEYTDAISNVIRAGLIDHPHVRERVRTWIAGQRSVMGYAELRAFKNINRPGPGLESGMRRSKTAANVWICRHSGKRFGDKSLSANQRTIESIRRWLVKKAQEGARGKVDEIAQEAGLSPTDLRALAGRLAKSRQAFHQRLKRLNALPTSE